MELRPIALALDALADAARDHEVPPDELELKFPFESPLGPCFIGVQAPAMVDGASDGGNDARDRWLSSYLFWDGRGESASYAFEVVAVKGGGSCELLGGFGCCMDDAWQKGLGRGTPQLCKWARLRRAVLDGCTLRLTVVMLGPVETPATLDAALQVQSHLSDATLTSIGAMLDGPFTDVAVTAGGRTFRAHRVVLAAASPVFLGMLDGAMREARESAVELVGADAGAVKLLLRHLYGGAIEVPVSLAPQLYALADQYQAAEVLQQRLRLWLMALQLAPEALCELVPAAHALCRPAFERSLWSAAAENLDELSPLAAFAAWPADAVVEVIWWARPLPAFNAAVAWMEAQPRPAKQRHVWPRLLEAVPWARASASDLRAMQQHPRAGQAPGLERRQLEAALCLCKGVEKERDEGKEENQRLEERLQTQRQELDRLRQQRRQRQ
jgi:hypothetical protein